MTQPSPARSTTTIVFNTPAPELADLEILDISGRTTRVLLSGTRHPAGRHVVLWDGRDETGRHVVSGVCTTGCWAPVETYL